MVVKSASSFSSTETFNLTIAGGTVVTEDRFTSCHASRGLVVLDIKIMCEAGRKVHRLHGDDFVRDELVTESSSYDRQSNFVEAGDITDLVRFIQGSECLGLVLKQRGHSDLAIVTLTDTVKKFGSVPLL